MKVVDERDVVEEEARRDLVLNGVGEWLKPAAIWPFRTEQDCR